MANKKKSVSSAKPASKAGSSGVNTQNSAKKAKSKGGGNAASRPRSASTKSTGNTAADKAARKNAARMEKKRRDRNTSFYCLLIAGAALIFCHVLSEFGWISYAYERYFTVMGYICVVFAMVYKFIIVRALEKRERERAGAVVRNAANVSKKEAKHLSERHDSSAGSRSRTTSKAAALLPGKRGEEEKKVQAVAAQRKELEKEQKDKAEKGQ